MHIRDLRSTWRYFSRDPQASLIQEMLERYPSKPIFVVVRPVESSGSTTASEVADFTDQSSIGDSSSIWEPSVVSGTVSGMLIAREAGIPPSRVESDDQDEKDTSNTAVCLSASQFVCCQCSLTRCTGLSAQCVLHCTYCWKSRGVLCRCSGLTA
jgi:hypothetical protein